MNDDAKTLEGPDPGAAPQQEEDVAPAEEGTPGGLAVRDEPREIPRSAEVATVLADEPLDKNYYVTLQPLTIDLVARQLERIGVRFRLIDDAIQATWEGFTVAIKVYSGQVLFVRATIGGPSPAAAALLVAARCNWWNAHKIFMQASASTVVAKPTPSEDGTVGPSTSVVVVHLDCVVPFSGGIAPVQLQVLLRRVVANISEFIEAAKIAETVSGLNWS